jgi:hypothetical protein
MKVFFFTILVVAASAHPLNEKVGTFDFPYNFIRLPENRIVGGNATDVEKFPYIGSLQRYGSHICGISILSSTFAITAGKLNLI